MTIALKKMKGRGWLGPSPAAITPRALVWDPTLYGNKQS